MPGERCAVAVCSNSRVKTRELTGEKPKILYHRFPKDPEISKQWAQFCRRADKLFNPATSVICSEHFTEKDYERDLKAELLNIAPKRVLKSDAIPSNFLLLKQTVAENLTTNNDREARIKGRESKKLVETLVSSVLVEDEASSEINQLSIALQENEELKKEIGCLREQVTSLLQKTNEDAASISKLKRENQYLRRKNNKTPLKYKKMHKVLTSMFTSNQISVLLGLKKHVNWTSEEISLAFTLRYLSKRCFLFLRRKLNIPLPGISTLQRWASRFQIQQGLLETVFKYLEAAKVTLKAVERVVVIQFDEIKVRKVLEYDQKNDQVVGPHTNMQVISARGLFSKWKQPLYLNFDTQVTKDTLMNVIGRLKETGFTVKACVSDMGGGNVGLWKQLEINAQQTFFTTPTDEKVYMFADAPHVLKLVRNWFLDTGFSLSDGRSVSKDPVAQLIQLEATQELRICHKVSEKHLTVQKVQRQNVRMACELLSHTTATALLHHLGETELAQNTSYFIGLVNKWFDIMNSYIPRKYGEPFQKPYGHDLEKQDLILEDMKNVMATMRCNGKKTQQLFQKGCIISITSLQELYKELRNTYGIEYILTHRLNQDCLENMFSQIRSRGGLDDHPSPLAAVYRLRMIILGKTQGMLQNNTNTNNPEDDTETIVSKVLRVAGVKLQEETRYQSVSMNNEESDEFPYMSTQSDCHRSTSDLKNDAFEYLAGWVAKKHKAEYPYLEGDSEHQEEHSFQSNSWTKHLTYGGLTYPSADWLKQAKCIDEEFIIFHKDCISKEPGKLYVTLFYNTDFYLLL